MEKRKFSWELFTELGSNIVVKDTKKKNKIGINLDFEQSDDSEPYGDYFKSLQTY